MMYGAALPLLYPIALVSYAVLYIQDIGLLVWFAKKPQTYDEELNKRFISVIKRSPYVLLPMAFWQLTSPELLPYGGLTAPPIERLSQPKLTAHRIDLYF